MSGTGGNGFLKKLNGHRTATLSTIGGILLIVFTAGGGWRLVMADVERLDNKVKKLEEETVDRRELRLTLRPIEQKLQNLNKSLQETKQMQKQQNQEILRELRRISDG